MAGWDGLVAFQDVIQRGHTCALRVRALLRLLELLRVTEEDDAAGGQRRGEGVR